MLKLSSLHQTKYRHWQFFCQFFSRLDLVDLFALRRALFFEFSSAFISNDGLKDISVADYMMLGSAAYTTLPTVYMNASISDSVYNIESALGVDSQVFMGLPANAIHATDADVSDALNMQSDTAGTVGAVASTFDLANNPSEMQLSTIQEATAVLEAENAPAIDNLTLDIKVQDFISNANARLATSAPILPKPAMKEFYVQN